MLRRMTCMMSAHSFPAIINSGKSFLGESGCSIEAGPSRIRDYTMVVTRKRMPGTLLIPMEDRPEATMEAQDNERVNI